MNRRLALLGLGLITVGLAPRVGGAGGPVEVDHMVICTDDAAPSTPAIEQLEMLNSKINRGRADWVARSPDLGIRYPVFITEPFHASTPVIVSGVDRLYACTTLDKVQ